MRRLLQWLLMGLTGSWCVFGVGIRPDRYPMYSQAVENLPSPGGVWQRWRRR